MAELRASLFAACLSTYCGDSVCRGDRWDKGVKTPFWTLKLRTAAVLCCHCILGACQVSADSGPLRAFPRDVLATSLLTSPCPPHLCAPPRLQVLLALMSYHQKCFLKGL